TYTTPQCWAVNYCAYMTANLNMWTDMTNGDVTWLCADVRNYLKDRSLKWPPRRSIVGQFDWTREQKHERYSDFRDPGEFGYRGHWEKGVWLVKQEYAYDRLEMVGIPPAWSPTYDFAERVSFGMLVNEARAYVTRKRKDIVRDWVLPLEPDFIVGKWSPESKAQLGIDPEPIAHATIPEVVGRARCTFTTPSSGSGWATTKPWEAFALGVVCFFHPNYDTQGHVVPTRQQLARGEVSDDELAALARWLRPRTPDELMKGVRAVNESRETFEWLVAAQRRRWESARDERRALHEILGRLP
ncbi:MAG: hypothetical protein ACRD2A_12945, partial [Vicinamibacterales bacterium]